MIIYEEVTTTAEIKRVYPERRVWLPALTLAPPHSPEYDQWIRDNWWMVDYSVFMGDKAQAQELAQKLQGAFSENPSHPDIPNLLGKLKQLESKSPGKRTPLEYWTHSAYQLANYCGGIDVYDTICEKLDAYSGEVLEALCGHSTYFTESPRRSITALDYCKVSLERYPFPHRRRIQCDLDQIRGAAQLSFFSEGQLDAISICFGFRYPKNIGKLIAEFRRVLKPSGILSFVENPGHGYEHLSHRHFVQGNVRRLLKHHGFGSVSIHRMDIADWDGKVRSPFYHVQATT